MDADIFIFIALELAAVLATVLLVVTVLTLQSPTTDADVEGGAVVVVGLMTNSDGPQN